MEHILVESLERLAQDICTAETITQLYAGESSTTLWQPLNESGFLDVLLSEDQGGAGLTLSQSATLFKLMGYYAMPVPLAHTMLARAWFAAANGALADGFVAFAKTTSAQLGAEQLTVNLPYGVVADFALVTDSKQVVLLPMAQATMTRMGTGSLFVQAHWDNWRAVAAEVSAGVQDQAAAIEYASAVAYAALMSGAAERVLELTLDYAQQRSQFGRQIGRFQAIQALIVQLAQRNEAMNMGVQIGSQSADLFPSPHLAMIAASRAADGAPFIADSSHAVFGAIGITQECELHLYTRSLREWRLAMGTASYWETQLGEYLLNQPTKTLLQSLSEPI